MRTKPADINISLNTEDRLISYYGRCFGEAGGGGGGTFYIVCVTEPEQRVTSSELSRAMTDLRQQLSLGWP